MIPYRLKLFDLLAIVCGALGIIVWAYLTAGYSRGPSDFTQDYAAARLLLEGRSIYGETVTAFARDVLGFGEHLNFHPPTNALYFVPFALLPYDIAFIVWNCLGLSLYVWIIVAAQRLYPLPVKTPTLIGLGLIWWPFIHTSALGQSSLVIAASIIKGWKELRQERAIRGGAWWGFAATVKLFPAFLGLYLLLGRKHAALGSMIGVFSLVSGVATAVAGLPDTITYITHIIPADVRDWSTFPLNCSIYGVILPLFTATTYVSPAIAFPYDTVVLAIKIVVLLLVAVTTASGYRAMRAGRRDECFHTVLLTMLLVSPITWVHIFPVLIPTLAFLAQRATVSSSRCWLLFALIAMSEPNTLTTRATVAFFSPALIPWEVYLLLRVSTLGLVVLLTLVLASNRPAPIPER